MKFQYLNTILNPQQSAYKQRYVEDRAYSYFGPTLGSVITLQAADYVVTTDESIWPFTDEVIDKGIFFPKEMDLQYFQRRQTSKNYARVEVVKSFDKYTYSREVQKLSTIVSYIGGVISCFLTAFFIMNSYTSFAFQVSMANQIFTERSSRNSLKTN